MAVSWKSEWMLPLTIVSLLSPWPDRPWNPHLSGRPSNARWASRSPGSVPTGWTRQANTGGAWTSEAIFSVIIYIVVTVPHEASSAKSFTIGSVKGQVRYALTKVTQEQRSSMV